MEKIRQLYSKLNETFTRHVILVLAVVLLLTKNTAVGMNNSYKMMAMDSAPTFARGAMNSRAYTANANSSSGRMLETNASIAIVAKNSDKVKEAVVAKVEELGGNVKSNNSYKVQKKMNYNLTVDVPVKDLIVLTDFIKAQGKLQNENIAVRDQTEYYADNRGRLENLYIRRDKLRDMMKTQTDKLADLLAIDKELSRVQSEIDSLERTDRRIKKQDAFANLDISVMPDVLMFDVNNGSWTLVGALNRSINHLIHFSQAMADVLIHVAIFSPFILVLWLCFKIKVRFKKK